MDEEDTGAYKGQNPFSLHLAVPLHCKIATYINKTHIRR